MRSSAVSRICPACIPCRANAAVYTATSRPWPTLAAACWVARSRGRRASRSGARPAAIAPEDTSTTWLPSFTRAASPPASAAIRPSSIRPSVVSEDEPTLTTTRRAVAMSPRSSAGVPRCPGWPPVAAAGWPRRPALSPRAPPARARSASPPSPVPVTRAALRRCRAGRNRGPWPPGRPGPRRTPAGRAVPPAPPRAPLCPPPLGRCLPHAEGGQPVTEVADRLGVAEIGLPHPAGGLVPAHQEAVLADPDDIELGPARR